MPSSSEPVIDASHRDALVPARRSVERWIARVHTWSLGLAALPGNRRRTVNIKVIDADWCSSYFRRKASGPEIVVCGRNGREGLSPPILIHEYGHALHFFVKSPQGGDFEEGFCDFFAAAWLTAWRRIAPNPQVFPDVVDLAGRRLDRTGRFDDPRVRFGDRYSRGDLFGSVLWDVFCAMGARDRALRALTNLYLESIKALGPYAWLRDLAEEMVNRAKDPAVVRPLKSGFTKRGLSL